MTLRFGSTLCACLGVFAVLGQPAFAQDTPAEPAASPASLTSAARTIIYHPRDIVSLTARLRYTTLIVLPDGEQVVEATCGDRDHWLVNVRDGMVSIKPTQPGVASNLNLVTTTGAVYGFLLQEQSNASKDQGDAAVDLTVYIERDDTAIPVATPSGGGSRRFVSAEQLEDYRQQAELARDQAEQAKAAARAELDAGLTAYRTQYPLSMRFPYRIENRKGPFHIRTMWHDDHRTFIQTDARELPALYEYQDRRPALVNFDVRDGTYIVPKIVRDGYLQLGNTRLGFRRQEGK
jgi:type IV secretion system protein VirB9